MSKKRKNNNLSTSTKVTIGALSLLSVVGGWNIIGNMEKTASADNLAAKELPTPTATAVQPIPTPWPTIQSVGEIPRLKIDPIPTLSLSAANPERSSLEGQANLETDAPFALSAMPNAVPMPTLAPLPALPEYVPPPPPPPAKPSTGSSGSGGSTSKGS